MRLVRAMFNWLLVFSSPLWIIQFVVYQSVKAKDTGWMTGKGSML